MLDNFIVINDTTYGHGVTLDGNGTTSIDQLANLSTGAIIVVDTMNRTLVDKAHLFLASNSDFFQLAYRDKAGSLFFSESMEQGKLTVNPVDNYVALVEKAVKLTLPASTEAGTLVVNIISTDHTKFKDEQYSVYYSAAGLPLTSDAITSLYNDILADSKLVTPTNGASFLTLTGKAKTNFYVTTEGLTSDNESIGTYISITTPFVTGNGSYAELLQLELEAQSKHGKVTGNKYTDDLYNYPSQLDSSKTYDELSVQFKKSKFDALQDNGESYLFNILIVCEHGGAAIDDLKAILADAV